MTKITAQHDAGGGGGVASDVKRLGRFALFGVYVVLACAYLLWRVLFTINGDHVVYAWIFLAAEALCMLTASAFYFLTAGRDDPPEPQRLDPSPLVDVFIATFNEDVDLVRTTAIAARDMDEPHRTWICDDGRRGAVEELAGDLGIGYLTRPDNAHAKAGNLNNALRRTDGELVLVLDVDHVPRRSLLTRLLGYFADPRVAVVQIPQVFYNIDSFQHHSHGGVHREVWHESTLFHHAIQPGAARLNTAFFVGTGALLRRSALLAVGGFAEGTVTEDIHTSLRLHAAGYRLVYVDEPLAFLLAPDTPVAYACQRLRWAQGAMQVLRGERALWKRNGLTLGQRVGYLNALTVYLTSYYHLVFYAAPGLFILLGVSPIAADAAVALPVFASRMLIDAAVFKLATGRQGRLFLSECFRMMNLSLNIRASWALIFPNGHAFRVTPKGQHGGVALSLLVPILVIVLFNLTAVGVALHRLGAAPNGIGALLLATFFAGQFALAGALAMLHVYERRSVDERFVFPVSFKAHLRMDEGDAQVRGVHIRRINRWHAYITGDDLPLEGIGTLELIATNIRRPIRVRFHGTEPMKSEGSGLTISRVALLNLTAIEGDRLESMLFNDSLPAFFTSARPAAWPTAGEGLDPKPSEVTGAFVPVRSGIL